LAALVSVKQYILAWRADLERRGLAGATIRRKLAALASLFDHLLDGNALAGGNSVHGVRRPRTETNEGKTPALGDHQAKPLLDASDDTSLKGLRDRVILAGLLYHGLRREEAAQLQINHLVERRDIQHLMIHGKGDKVRYLPVHPVAADHIHSYLERSGHQLADPKGPLFAPLRHLAKGLGVTANGIYTLVEAYAKKAGIHVDGLGVHDLRGTAATNALEHEADLAKVQAWLGHANISTTKIYDRRQNRPEALPTYRVKY
jgi:site-specific recombinase XerD